MDVSSFRKYKNEKGRKEEFVVFIIHGKSKIWKHVKKYINEQLQFATVVLIEEVDQGDLLHLFKESVWEDCDCAVAIMSPDDKMKNGRVRARQNVLFEIGYCQGLWDHYYQDDNIKPVIILKEKKVEMPSDLAGNKVILYNEGQISKSLDKLSVALESIFYYLDESESYKVSSKKASAKGVSRRLIRRK
jgi:predicted nucleotide-binding protein